MVSSNANALGVIFANSYDNLVPELVAERTMASIPFAGRYRMIDFTLSNMAKLRRGQRFDHRAQELSFSDGPPGLRP